MLNEVRCSGKIQGIGKGQELPDTTLTSISAMQPTSDTHSHGEFCDGKLCQNMGAHDLDNLRNINKRKSITVFILANSSLSAIFLSRRLWSLIE